LPQVLTLQASRHTVYLFSGKFSHVNAYADNELWTVTFPDAIREDSVAIVICQWTETADSKRKQNSEWKGKITRADNEGSGEIRIEIFKDDSTLYYWYVLRSSCDPAIAAC
jgi:hypothetical protein